MVFIHKSIINNLKEIQCNDATFLVCFEFLTDQNLSKL